MYSQDGLLELIELVYAAAGDPAKWTAVLERLAHIFQGNVGTIHHQDTSSKESSFSSLWNIGPESIIPYVAYYGARNPLMTTHPRMIYTGAVNTLQMLCPTDAYLRSEFWNDYMSAFDVPHCIAATLQSDGAISSNLTIFRPPKGEAFDEDERQFLLALVPHLQRAFQLHSRIQGLETKGNSATEILDHFDQGVILLDARGQVLFINQVANTLFAGENGLRLSPRGLTVAVASENKRLNTLIQGALVTGSGKGLHAGGAMTISRGSLRRPLQALVTPLRTKTIHLGKQTPVVAIFISDPGGKPVSNAAVFAQLFGLTPAEARLAKLLAAGSALKEASERLGVTQSTLRTQLKSIFAKTNTNRQSQLVRLLLLAPGQHARSRIVDANVLR